jgi:hopanoid biosynthesis associated protein HpnK
MQVILTADDFGRSAAVNAAVLRAHREGVLTSASLMVAGEAAAQAVALAQETPSLAVGLHLVAVDGPAVLRPAEIPHLVNGRGRFPADPFRLGLRYVASAAAREELRRELAAQFQRFAATGLPLSHVDGHRHMHMHPAVFAILLPLARQYGAGGIRLVREDLWLGLQGDRRRTLTKVSWALAFGLLSRWGARRLRGSPFIVVQRVYGLMQSGQMTEGYLVSLLGRLTVPTAEVYFHPSTTAEEAWGPNPGDLAALLSPAVRRLIGERHIRLATYPLLKGV